MKRRALVGAVAAAFSISDQLQAQSFGSGGQELTPRGLALVIIGGIFILYKLLGSRI